MLIFTRYVIYSFLGITLFTACSVLPDNTIKKTGFTDVEVSNAPSSTSVKTRSTDTISIVAVGDIMLGSPYPTNDRMPPNDGADILKSVTAILSKADIAFGNLEGPLADTGESAKCKKNDQNPLAKDVKDTETETVANVKTRSGSKTVGCYAFRMPTRYANYIKEAGFDVLSLANNHAGDFGSEGMASTRRSLDALGIKHIGSNKTDHSTAVIDINSTRIAFIGFAHNAISPNVNDLAEARRLVLAAGKIADIIVVSFHGGAEGVSAQHVPQRTEVYGGAKRGNLPAFSRAVIDAGADLVLGHGPHVLRGMELYKNRLIAYSLGNFATYGWFKLQNETAVTMILEVELNKDGSFARGKIHPGKLIEWGIPEIGTSNDAIRIVRRLSNADFPKTAPKISDDGSF